MRSARVVVVPCVSAFVLVLSFCANSSSTNELASVYSSIRGLGYEYPRHSYPDTGTKLTPRWLIVGGRHVIPGSVYRLAVQSLKRRIPGENFPLTIKASISHDDKQVSGGKVHVHPGELSYVLLQIPDTSVHGYWQLTVEGIEGKNHLPVFKNTTALRFSPQFITILIQTSRPVYNTGQSARFRAVMLTRELKPYEGPVDVFVLDPRGRAMKRWPSRQTGEGVVNLKFDLPLFGEVGNWTIQVRARQQIQNKTILVEHYRRPRFEVFVRLPHTFKSTDDVIEGLVMANMTNYRDVFGNCSVELQVATNNDFPTPTKFETVYSEFHPNFTGGFVFRLPMDAVSARIHNLKNVVLRVFASVGDAFGWRIHHAWALARIVKEEVKVSFLGDEPLFFRPGMPVSVHILTAYEDNHPLEMEKLEDSQLIVTFKSSAVDIITINGTDLRKSEGVALCTSDIPENAKNLEVTARFVSHDGFSGAASLTGFVHHSPREHHLQIETSTYNANPGQFIILHVRSNFFIAHINYVVVANGLLIYSGREAVNDVSFPTVTTFSLPASAHMSPVAKVLVWVVDHHFEVVAHSIAIPVNPLGKHEVGMRWNEHKDHSRASAEIKVLGEIGAFFATSAVWEETHLMDAGNDFDAARILHHMMGFHDSGLQTTDEIIPHVKRATTRSREGYGSNVNLFPTSYGGPDVPTTFNFTELFLLTDAMVYYHPSKATDSSLCESDMIPCLTGGCYTVQQRCDGIPNCADSSDETGCPLNIDPWKYFRLHRISRIFRFYDEKHGDWAWQNIRKIGREIEVFDIPKRPQTWVFSVFAVGRESGLGILTEKVQFDSTRPFMLTLDAPRDARMWEQVGLTVGVFNFHHSTMGILLSLPYSPDYQSIVVEANGVVDSYDPRRLNGTFQHVVWLQAGTSIDVHIPIVFTRLGKVTVTVKGATHLLTDSETVMIEVLPEGATISKHTSVLFDLKSRAIAYEFFDIHLDESPIIPYSLNRRYIFGTTEGHVSVTGDIVGPSFPEIPVTEDSLVGFGVMGAETSAYNFAANVWTLHYLRVTNQITEDIVYKVLTAITKDYMQLSRYQSNLGGFANWVGSELSVWLTAHVVKSLWIASFQDWENYIYVDNTVTEGAVSFLLDHQTDQGSFMETDAYLSPLDSKVDPRSRHSWLPKYQNISLTAHVVIALEDVMPSLQGDLHRRANIGVQNAVKYLEKVLETLTDPYDLAVVTWALFKTESKEKSAAFSALHKMKRTEGDRVYWSREKIFFNEVVYEDSQRPYLKPKEETEWDAHAVEATAYALLVYIKTDGIGIVQENIVRFLASMRKTDGGHISTVDSIVAMEALIAYSFRARVRDITNMHVRIEQSSSPNQTIDVFLNSNNTLSKMQSFDLDNIFGHITISGQGSGQALVQLDYSYGVDVPEELEYPEVPSFELEVTSRFHGRNNSYLTITSCQRWINTEEGKASGVAVVDIHVPSGYFIMQNELTHLALSRTVRNLRWAVIRRTKALFFFNKLDTEPVCFTYQLERWFPVSNHSRYNVATIYELYQPERFEMKLFEVYPLYTLDICEVCGSYQCPYCPFYSASKQIVPGLAPAVIVTLYLMMYNPLWHFR